MRKLIFVALITLLGSIAAQAQCDPDLWNHTYDRNAKDRQGHIRLTTVDVCVTITGEIDRPAAELSDGDVHILIKPDPRYMYLVRRDADNQRLPDHKDRIVVELICRATPARNSISACDGYHPGYSYPYRKGTHVKITGRLVKDGWHGGYLELHPVTHFKVD